MNVFRRIFVEPLAGLFDLGPHNRAHVPALRAAGSVAVPLLLVWATGHIDWSPFVAFGAMTGIYGRNVSRRQRAAMQLQAGVALVLCVILGTMVSMHPQRDWVVVVGGAIIAGVVSVAAALLRWGPAGPLFQLFGFAVCANTAHSTWSTVALAGAIATGSMLFAVAISLIGRRETEPRPARPLPRAREAWDHFRSDATMRHLVRMGGATLSTGATATLLGLGHPYWGMVASAAPLASPTSSNQVLRAVHRAIGTLLGLVVAGLAILLLPRGLPMVLGIIVFQGAAELFVARNYTLGMLSITPLALLMGQLVHPTPVPQLLLDRGAETLIGVAISLAFTFLTHADDDEPEADDAGFLDAVRPPRG